MTLFQREEFEGFVKALPAVEIVRQWGDASVGKVGGKIFAILSVWDASGEWRLAYKCSELSFTMLCELDGIRPAPYLARAKWVQAAPRCALSEDELKAYIAEAHRLVAAKLTRASRAELGL